MITQTGAMMAPPRKYLVQVGQKFGRLTVISETRRNSVRYVQCLCDCGNETEALVKLVFTGHTTSCGCLMSEVSREKAVKRNTKHGLTTRVDPHPLHGVWYQQMQRCTDPGHPRWKDYGGRGIKFHEPWRDFAAWAAYVEMALGPKPTDDQRWTIDRADNEGHYEPDNLRWATYTTQARNSRKVRK